MTLADLTDPNAVLASIEECDQLGRTGFLAKYGFREARDYFLEFDGRRYDSKAIVGAAHGKQHGTPLTWDEFSGGGRTVAPKLAELGFYVVVASTDWSVPIGAITTRTEVADEYGGSIRSGIETPKSSANVLLYSDPIVGADHGYVYDGWDPDEAGVFFYTGEGKSGDQELKVGNRAILEHASADKVLRLFEAVDKGQQAGGKRQRYIGAFRIDSADPYRQEPAMGDDGNLRKVLVFRLLADQLLAVPKNPVDPPKYAVPRAAKAVVEAPVSLCPIHFMQLSVTGICADCE